MNVIESLNQEKLDLLNQISKAAKEENSELVLLASEKLGKIEMLINRYNILVNDISILKDTSAEKSKTIVPKISLLRPTFITQLGSNNRSARERGKELREAFTKKLTESGITLQQVKGKTIYTTKSKERVGIAIATERQPDRWFLGLQAGEFDHAVLLCQRENGETIEILLPKNFFTKYGNDLSQSKGQLKFNISRRGNGYVVQVPGTNGINPFSFANDYSFLN